jgi:hypothetical protein
MMGRASRAHAIAAAASLALASIASNATAQLSTGAAQPPPPSSLGASAAPMQRRSVTETGWATPARDVRVIPRGPTLPDLTHTTFEASFEQTTAALQPIGGGEYVTSQLFQVDGEVPIGRWLYVGAQYGAAAAKAPETEGTRFISSEPEIYGRAIYRGLGKYYTLGAGLGVVLPLVTYDSLSDAARLQPATAASLVSIVRPWDLVLFTDRHLTMRPWIDLRAARRHLVAQFRGGLDFAFRTGVPSGTAQNPVTNRVGDIEMVATGALYLGWKPTRELALGLEAWEVYLLKTQLDVADRDRITFALSPSMRFYYKWVEPSVSLLVPLGKPLLGAAESYVALRIDLRVWFGQPPW